MDIKKISKIGRFCPNICISMYMNTQIKTCYKCKQPKPISEFYKRTNEKYYRGCKKCEKEQFNTFRKNNPHISHLTNAKQRAKKFNLPFDLDKDWFYASIPEVCPVFGTIFETGKHGISIDRIIPEKGYVKSNCRIISHRANTIKNDASLAELKQLVQYLENLNNPISLKPMLSE